MPPEKSYGFNLILIPKLENLPNAATLDKAMQQGQIVTFQV